MNRLIRLVDRRLSERHKKTIASASSIYNYRKDVLFVFQCHNAKGVIGRVLEPFVREGYENILLFADGCHDSTASSAHKLLQGPRHIVISANNVHEIQNYRVSLSLAKQLGCKFAVLLQDDDIYADVESWLVECISWFSSDEHLAMVGLCGGFDLTDTSPNRAGASYSTSTWRRYNRAERICFGIDGCYELADSLPIMDSADNYYRYTAVVNRAPQVVLVDAAIDLGFFPQEMEPYQYDDMYNCFTAWEQGWRIGFLPKAIRLTAKEGGMRLYNDVTVSSRPLFHQRNINFVIDRFGTSWADGTISRLVASANKSLIDDVTP